jgi:uncharacterized protein YciW
MGLPFESPLTDTLAPAPGSRLEAALAARADIFAKTRTAEAAVLTPADPGGLPVALRHALAARIAALHGEPAEAARHAAAPGDAAVAALARPGTAAPDPRVQAMVAFTDAVSTSPRDIAAADIDALKAAGIGDADIVRLAELNAFLSYQLRLLAGLRLLKEAGA